MLGTRPTLVHLHNAPNRGYCLTRLANQNFVPANNQEPGTNNQEPVTDQPTNRLNRITKFNQQPNECQI